MYGDVQKRVKLLSHPEVESFLFIHKKKLHQLFLPHNIEEFDNDDTCTDRMGCSMDKGIDKYTIVSFDQNESMGNFVTYLLSLQTIPSTRDP